MQQLLSLEVKTKIQKEIKAPGFKPWCSFYLSSHCGGILLAQRLSQISY